MNDKTEAGLQVMREMLPEESQDKMREASDKSEFAWELQEIARDFIFGSLWARPGLSRRDRSLVTLGILITLRANDVLTHHFQVALNNGLTREELEEVIYHSAGYAGFTQADWARQAASI